MSSIDDRVVNMQFNNSQFQKGIADTNKSLGDLKSNLKLDGATDGMDNIQAAANHFSLAGIEDALANVSSHFSIFGAVGFTVIQSLTNTALNAGAQIANALIGPLVQGGAQRALALQQAKFQFEGLGLDVQTTMDAALAAVKGTAFGLDDAATAAAQFGASGITATTGLEGVLRSVAGVAAQTGSSYSSVAQIFESVAGNGRLMGQDLLQLSSRGVNAAAILGKAMGKSESDIREMVTKGKISFQEFSDAMSNAFGANASKANETYTGALANMHAALSRIGADVASPYFLDMRDVLNSLTPVLDGVHTALKPMLDEFAKIQNISSANLVKFFAAWDLPKLLGAASPGLAAAMDNIFNLISKIGDAIGGGFHEIFPPATVDGVTRVANAIATFTASLVPGTKAADDIKRSFAGFFAIIDIGLQLVFAIGDGIGRLFGYTAKGTGGFLEFTAKVGDWLVKVDEAIKKGEVFQKFFDTLGGIIAVPIAFLRTFFGIVHDGIEDLKHLDTSGFKKFADDIAARFKGLNELGQFFKDFWNGIVTVATAIWNFLQPIFHGIAEAISNAVDKVKGSIKGLSFGDSMQALNTGIFAAFLLVVKGFFGNLGGVLQGNGVAIVSSFKRVFGQLQVNLKALEMNTNAKTLETIAIAVALLAASAVALSLVDSGKLTLSLTAMSGMVAGLLAAFKSFSEIGGAKGIKEALVLALAIEGIAGAVLVLTGAIAILGALPLQNLVQGLLGIGIVIVGLVVAMQNMKDIGPEVLFAAGAMALMAPALAVLAGAVAILGALPIDNLVKGMAAFTIILGEMVGSIKLLSEGGPGLLFASIALISMAGAMATIVGVIALLGALKMGNLIQGLVALAIALAIMAGAMVIMEDGIPGSLAMIIAAAAITILAGALKIVATMSWDDIGRSMVVLAGSLLILAAAMLLMGDPIMLLGAAGLLAAAFALGILAPAMVLLGTISWDSIGRGLTVLAAALLILAAGGLLMIPASVGFVLLGAAVLLFGVGVLEAATGIGILAVAITALVAVGSAGTQVVMNSIQAFIDKLSALGEGVGKAVVSMAEAIGNGGSAMITALSKIVASMLTAVDQNVPNFIKTGTHIIDAMLQAADKEVPNFTNTGVDIIVKVLNGLAKRMPDMVTAGTNVIVNFITGVGNNVHRVTDAAADTIVKFVQGAADSINTHRKAMETAGQNLAWAIADGLTGGLASKARGVVSAAMNLVSGIPTAIRKFLGINSPSKVTTELAEWTGEGVVVGLDNKAGRVSDSATNLGMTAVNSLKQSMAGISDVMDAHLDTTPTIRPVIDTSGVKDGVAQIGSMLKAPTLSLGTSNDVATSVSLQEQARNAELVLAKNNPDNTDGKQLVFNQYNNSPVALTPAEIYRQTSNQLSTLKGELGVVNQSPGN